MEWSPICEKYVAEAVRTTLIWKAPGRDQIPNFWLKQPTVTHANIAAIFNKLIEELKQKVLAKTQRLSRYKKRQNQYYQNKLFRTDCKKSYNRLRQTYPKVNNAPGKKKWRTSGEKYMGKKFNIMKRRAG